MAVLCNAITMLFDCNKNISDHYGQDKARIMCEKMLAAVPLDREHDAPLPEWCIKLFCDETIGFRERIRIAFMHHKDITGESINHHLAKSWDGKRPASVTRRESSLIRKAMQARKEKGNG
jgi:hypothetical protein